MRESAGRRKEQVMNEKELREELISTIWGDEIDIPFRSVRSYEDEGILTMDEGIVLHLQDGSEFHITIQQVR